MTIAQLREMLFGKIVDKFDRDNAKAGTSKRDATAFGDLPVEEIGDALHRHGFSRTGNETMYDGRTGKMLPGKVFIGPVHYQLLKHMVLDKAHARSRGPCQLLTRQPVEGRSRDGGLRFGEVSFFCQNSQGYQFGVILLYCVHF